jgi:threonine dehydrogenase-like Zn-dependent dehydrogenase
MKLPTAINDWFARHEPFGELVLVFGVGLFGLLITMLAMLAFLP